MDFADCLKYSILSETLKLWNFSSAYRDPDKIHLCIKHDHRRWAWCGPCTLTCCVLPIPAGACRCFLLVLSRLSKLSRLLLPVKAVLPAASSRRHYAACWCQCSLVQILFSRSFFGFFNYWCWLGLQLGVHSPVRHLCWCSSGGRRRTLCHGGSGPFRSRSAACRGGRLARGPLQTRACRWGQGRRWMTRISTENNLTSLLQHKQRTEMRLGIVTTFGKYSKT